DCVAERGRSPADNHLRRQALAGPVPAARLGYSPRRSGSAGARNFYRHSVDSLTVFRRLVHAHAHNGTAPHQVPLGPAARGCGGQYADGEGEDDAAQALPCLPSLLHSPALPGSGSPEGRWPWMEPRIASTVMSTMGMANVNTGTIHRIV